MHLLDLLLALLHFLHDLLRGARRSTRLKAVADVWGHRLRRWLRLRLWYRLLVIVGIFVI